MRFERPQPRRDSEANLIPLINVVFLLLIFFMLAGRLTPTESMSLEPPRSDRADAALPTILVISIDRDGRTLMAGETLDETALVERLAETLAVAEGPRRLQIKADAHLEAGRLIALLERLRAAGAEELDLLTLARDGA